MNRIVASALALWLSVPYALGAAAPLDLPAGVNYTPASETETAAASTRLRDALTGGPRALAPLFGLDADSTVMVGPYLAIEINGHGLEGRKLLSTAHYHLPVPGGEPLTVDSFRAKAREQKLFLAYYLDLMADFSGPLTIRAPTFDELAITWAWIAWDLDGPVLVVESEHDKYLFDFDPRTGFISWVERFTRPCFSLGQEDRQLLSCTCTGVAREGRKWELSFSQQQSCSGPIIANVTSAAAQKAAASKPPVFIEVSERTGPVDALLARHFGGDYTIAVLAENTRNFQGPGKLLEGVPPAAPKDARGEPVHAYVLLGSVIGADGRAIDNRILISTDERASVAVLEAARGWRLEPATRDGKTVAEIVWQQLTL